MSIFIHFALIIMLTGPQSDLYPELVHHIEALEEAQTELAQDRKESLTFAAEDIAKHLSSSEQAELIFICTHNSRRSQISQAWAAALSHHFGIQGIHPYSGGTEATAFNARAAAALERAGFELVQKMKDGAYALRFALDSEPLEMFSKTYGDKHNPQRDFFAFMVCGDADENCPIVSGAKRRYSLPFVDPKHADGTEDEAAAYDKAVMQIGTEMYFLFQQLAQLQK